MKTALQFLRRLMGRVSQDEKFRVLPFGRDELKYIEEDHELLAQAELGTSPDRILYASTISKWLPPYEQEPISPERKQEIINRLVDYYKRQKVTCDVA